MTGGDLGGVGLVWGATKGAWCTASFFAHGIGGREDLPLPFDLVLRGAAVALLASFLGLGVLWRTPRLRGASAGRPLPSPVQRLADSGWTRRAMRLLGLVATAYVAVAAVFGSNDALNPTPYVVYVVFWVGLVPASLLAGPVWRLVNPLRTIHAMISWLLRRPPEHGLLRLPRRWGYWPAALSLASFVWLELAAPGRDTLPVLRLYFGTYAAAHLTAATLFGSRWFAVGDGFEAYSTLIGKLSPFGRREDGQLVVRNPLDGAATLRPTAGLVAMVAVLLGSTAFDSLVGAPSWVRLVQAAAIPRTALDAGGLFLMIGLVAGTYLAATRLAGRLGQEGCTRVPRLLAHSIVPIIVGYVVAHYFSYLLFQGQHAVVLLSDPLGTGANLLGTATRGVDYSLVGPAAIASIQVVAIVGGHIAGVISAHDRAIALFPERAAISGQLPLLVLMVAYTVGGLFLLFAT